MANETPPFTLTGWLLSRAADRAELVFTYLHKLKHAKGMQDRMLVHADFVKMRMEKYSDHVKTASDALVMTHTLVGSVIQVLRHKEHSEELAQNNSARTEELPVEQKPKTLSKAEVMARLGMSEQE